MTVEHDIDKTPAEIDGLHCAYLLDGDGGGKALDWADVRAWNPSDGLLWVHLDRMAEPARDWLLNESGIAKVVDESLLADETRPRILAERDALVVFLRGVNLNPGANPEDMVDVRCHIEANRIVTLRDARLMAIKDLREAIDRGAGPKTSGEFLVRMADRLIDRMGSVITEIDEALDDLVHSVQQMASAELRGRLRRTRQISIMLRRYLAPQRDAVLRLRVERPTWLSDLDCAVLREVADRTTRYVEDLEAARERAAAVQEEFNYQISERMNRTMYALTVVAAILLPPSLVAGLFGINVGGMPGIDNNAAFWIVVAAVAVLAVVEYICLRKLRWI
ncbi:MAG: zinc transporter ZntB [Alphaproteobacteria bacterium]|nr:zinc transporter ZntB [Alphaproteobacteria bacterium]